MTIVAAKWRALDDAERKKYNDRSAEMKVTALRCGSHVQAALWQRLGCWLLAMGSRPPPWVARSRACTLARSRTRAHRASTLTKRSDRSVVHMRDRPPPCRLCARV